MDCPSERELSALIDAEGDDSTGVVKKHVAACADCRRRLEGLRAADRAIRSAFASIDAPSTQTAVQRLRKHAVRTRCILAVAASVALAVVGVAWFVLRPGSDADGQSGAPVTAARPRHPDVEAPTTPPRAVAFPVPKWIGPVPPEETYDEFKARLCAPRKPQPTMEERFTAYDERAIEKLAASLDRDGSG